MLGEDETPDSAVHENGENEVECIWKTLHMLGLFLSAELIWSQSHSAVPPWQQHQVSPAGEEQNIEVAD